jgi:hypothetical protein
MNRHRARARPRRGHRVAPPGTGKIANSPFQFLHGDQMRNRLFPIDALPRRPKSVLDLHCREWNYSQSGGRCSGGGSQGRRAKNGDRREGRNEPLPSSDNFYPRASAGRFRDASEVGLHPLRPHRRTTGQVRRWHRLLQFYHRPPGHGGPRCRSQSKRNYTRYGCSCGRSRRSAPCPRPSPPPSSNCSNPEAYSRRSRMSRMAARTW